jgi:hypothetical protein
VSSCRYAEEVDDGFGDAPLEVGDVRVGAAGRREKPKPS